MSHKNRCINWNSAPINLWFDIFTVRPFVNIFLQLILLLKSHLLHDAPLHCLGFPSIIAMLCPSHAIFKISSAYFSLFSIFLLLPVPQLIRYFLKISQCIRVWMLWYSRLTVFHLCYDSASLFAFSVQFIPPSFSKTVYKLF